MTRKIHTINTNNFSLYSTPPPTEEGFGHYLAGLIDGDGHFSIKRLEVVFSAPDLFLAEYLKVKLNAGNIYKIKDKKAYNLVIGRKADLELIINLINGKLRKQSKLDQINKNIINKYAAALDIPDKLILNTKEDLNNHWLSGFSDADGSFQIKILIREKRTEIRLKFQVDQKEKLLLDLIHKKFGGYLGYRGNQDTYYYGTTSFKSAKSVIDYFDEYNLLSAKHLSYLEWKKAYALIEKKLHLTESGIQEIIQLKNNMNSRRECAPATQKVAGPDAN